MKTIVGLFEQKKSNGHKGNDSQNISAGIQWL